MTFPIPIISLSEGSTDLKSGLESILVTTHGKTVSVMKDGIAFSVVSM